MTNTDYRITVYGHDWAQRLLRQALQQGAKGHNLLSSWSNLRNEEVQRCF